MSFGSYYFINDEPFVLLTHFAQKNLYLNQKFRISVPVSHKYYRNRNPYTNSHQLILNIVTPSIHPHTPFCIHCTYKQTQNIIKIKWKWWTFTIIHNQTRCCVCINTNPSQHFKLYILRIYKHMKTCILCILNWVNLNC